MTEQKKAIITLTVEGEGPLPSLDRLSEITQALSFIAGGSGEVKHIDLQDDRAIISVEEMTPGGWKDSQIVSNHFVSDFEDEDADNEDFTPVDYDEDDVEEEGDLEEDDDEY